MNEPEEVVRQLRENVNDQDNQTVEHIDPPGRNDPCPCGSGRKYKNCCQIRKKVVHGHKADAKKARKAVERIAMSGKVPESARKKTLQSLVRYTENYIDRLKDDEPE